MFCIWYFSHLTHLTIDITDSDIACPSLCLSVHSKKSFYYDHVKFPKECRETYCFEMVNEEFFVVWLSYRLLIIIKPVSVSMSTPLTLSYFHWKFSAQLLCTSWCKNAIQLQSYYRLRLQTHCYLHDLIFFFDIVIPVYCSERVNEEFFVVWLSYRLLIIIKPISVPMSTPLTLSNFHWKFSAQLLCTSWCKKCNSATILRSLLHELQTQTTDSLLFTWLNSITGILYFLKNKLIPNHRRP